MPQVTRSETLSEASDWIVFYVPGSDGSTNI